MKRARTVVTVAALLLAACGGSSKKAETGPGSAAEPEAAPAAEPGAAGEASARPAMGPDECCCPFASAEGVAFNVSPKADCEDAGSECVEAERCAE